MGKRFVVLILVVFTISAFGAVVFLEFFLPDMAREEILKATNTDPARNLEFSKISFGYAFPLTATLENVQYQDKKVGASATIPSVVIRLKPDFSVMSEIIYRAMNRAMNGGMNQEASAETPELENLGDLEIALQNPAVQWTEAPATNSSLPPIPSTDKPPPELKIPFGKVALKITDGNLSIKVPSKGLTGTYEAFSLNIQFDEPLAPWTVILEGNLKVKQKDLDLHFPLGIRASLVDPLKEKIQFQKSEMTIAAVPLSFSGWFNRRTNRGDLTASTELDDLKKLAPLYSKFTKDTFSGSLKANLKAKSMEQGGWTLNGHIDAAEIVGTITKEFSFGKYKGPFQLDLSTDFTYAEALSIQALKLRTNLEASEISVGEYFRKEPGMPFMIEADGTLVNDLATLKVFKILLGKIRFQSEGTVSTSPGGLSNLKISLPTTSLGGMEKNFPIFSKAPLFGSIQLEGSLSGDLQNPEALKVALRPLKLTGISGTVDYRSADKKTEVTGPVKLDADIDLVAEGKTIQSATLNGFLDLNSISMFTEGGFKKASTSPLSLKINARKSGDKIAIQSGQIFILEDRIDFGGQFSQPQRPELDITVRSQRITLPPLMKMFPSLMPYLKIGLDGVGSLDLRLRGIYDFKAGIEKSPLTVSGRIGANLKPITIPVDKEEEKLAPSSDLPTPLLPDWPIARTGEVLMAINAESLTHGKIHIEQVNLTGTVKNGVFGGSLGAKDFFGGSFRLTEIAYSGKVARPDLEGKIDFKDIDLSSALNYMSVEWGKLGDGKAAGSIRFLLPHKSSPELAKKTRAEGKFTLADAVFSTIPFTQMVNDQISKIPGLAEKVNVDSPPVKGELNAEFKMNDGVMNFRLLRFLSIDRSELNATGSIGVNLQANLSGTAAIANSPVRGIVLEANSDQQKRFVIPILIRGSLLSPKFEFAEASVKAILERTAKFELTKRTNQVKNTVKAKVDEKKKEILESARDQIQKKTKDALKDIFGQ